MNHGPIEDSYKWWVDPWQGAFRDIADDSRCIHEGLVNCPGYSHEKKNVSRQINYSVLQRYRWTILGFSLYVCRDIAVSPRSRRDGEACITTREGLRALEE